MLPNSPDVEAVALGKNGFHEAARSGQLLIDMSTINPLIAKSIGSRLAPFGVSVVDAPVSGGERGAIKGALTLQRANGRALDPEHFIGQFTKLRDGHQISDLVAVP